MLETGGKNIEAVLAEKGEVISSTSGVSMYPMLRHRQDMVVVKKVERPLRKNDVPLYRLKSGKLVLHRILKVTDKGYIIRGDNLYKKEYNITDDNIIGLLKAFYRNGKYYDCETSLAYKLYVTYIRISYPLRFILFHKLRPILGRAKRFILKKLGK